jgi:hypothetical protein
MILSDRDSDRNSDRERKGHLIPDREQDPERKVPYQGVASGMEGGSRSRGSWWCPDVGLRVAGWKRW